MISSTKIWYHSTSIDAAEDIIQNGWKLYVPRKTDPGDLGWGIYFYPHTYGQYGSALIKAEIDMSDVIDINSQDPKALLWKQLVEIKSKDNPSQVNTYRTIKQDIHSSGFLERITKDDPEYYKNPTKVKYIRDYYRKLKDSRFREENAKVIRRTMLRYGIKGIYNGSELVVYDPSIIISTSIVKRASRKSNWLIVSQSHKNGIGYKIVAYNGKHFYSLYSKQILHIEIGKSLSFPGEGLFLGNSKQYCLDYFSEGTDDQDAILSFEYNVEDIIRGDPNALNGEIQVRKAKIVNIEIIPKAE